MGRLPRHVLFTREGAHGGHMVVALRVRATVKPSIKVASTTDANYSGGPHRIDPVPEGPNHTDFHMFLRVVSLELPQAIITFNHEE